MTRIALKSISSRRLRTALTALAIVLGVAMVSGAYTLTDAMRGAADSLSKASYEGTAAVVSAKTAFDLGADDDFGQRPTIPETALAEVEAHAPRAVGSITDEAKLLDEEGDVIGSGPYFGTGLDRYAGELTPFRLKEGRFAAGPGEVVIDAGTAEKQGWAVGDSIRVQTRGPADEAEVTGIASFGDVDSIGTATFALFELRAAQELFAKRGRFDEILVAGDAGVRSALAGALPRYEVQTAEEHDRFTLDDLKSFVSFIQVFLLVFGGIAVFVGAFTIFNTLSITVAQRSRELALLRALGASRGQVLRSVVAEALALGAVASLIGLVAGLGLARLLSSVFASLGLDLPQTGTVFATRTVVVSLSVGVLVTLLAGLGPALRATRVSPVTALREGAEVPPGRIGRHATRIAAGVGALALAVLGLGMFAPGIEAEGRLALLAPAALLLFVAVALVSPRLVPPLASVLGRPAARLAGSAGVLARRNAMRNPGRTAATAAALMIGIALVAFSAVIGNGLRESTKGAIADSVKADFVLAGQDGWSQIDPEAIEAAARVPGVEVATGIVQDRGRALGEKVSVDGVEPAAIGEVLGEEAFASLAGTGGSGAVVTDKFAEEHDLDEGDGLAVTAPSGKRLGLRVTAIAHPDRFNPLGMGELTIARSAYDRAFAEDRERFAFVGAGDASRAALERSLAAFADVKLQSRSEFETDQSAWVDQILAIFYVLLGLAVIVSLFGIVNTLALSVLERTRELGMLRAIGMTRRQVRRMVRHESVVTALIGAALGIGVGLMLAGLATTALSDEGLRFAVPVGSLVAFSVVAALAGVLAAIGPARRASRLDPLAALQYE
jgi:putative ABC transport system permease protein